MPAPLRKTVDDLLAMGEDVRAELIDGEIVQKAMPSTEHSFAQGNLSAWVHRRYNRKLGGRWPGGWRIGPEIHVIYGPHQVFCHDLVGWRRERVPELPEQNWSTIRPDWVCEVLSPNHEKRDLVDKLKTLHAAGVPNYWVIDRVEKILSLYRHDARAFLVRAASAGETIRAEPFEDIELRTGIIFGDEDDDE
jgi:Uma2 family endonuclease